MATTKSSHLVQASTANASEPSSPRPRGRPRRFDPDEAVAVAQALFHSRGYDAVSVADVTEALGIKPPSFYTAFDSKAGLYARVLARYAEHGALPMPALLRPDRPVAEGLLALLEEAARQYTADPVATGCLVLESTRCNDEEARSAARAILKAAEAAIRHYIAERRPQEADRLTEFVSTTMLGMSAKARLGQGKEALLATARVAGVGIAGVLGETPKR